MEEEQQTKNKKEIKKITVGLILSWGLGTLAFISGVIWLFIHFLTGILILLLAAVLLPPVNKLVADRFKFSISWGLKFILVIILLSLIGATQGTRTLEKVEKGKEKIGVESVATKSYQEVFTFSGDGAKKSEPFTITGDRFKIVYECTGDPALTLCQAFVYEVSSALPQLIVNTNKPIKDETVIYGSGEYYIDANMIGSFNMSVYDYR